MRTHRNSSTAQTSVVPEEGRLGGTPRFGRKGIRLFMTLIAAVLGNFCTNEHNALASILFQAQDVGGNVEVAWSGGTWNVTGFNTPAQFTGATNFAQFGSSFDYLFEGGVGALDRYTYTTTPSPVISGFVVSASGTATTGEVDPKSWTVFGLQ